MGLRCGGRARRRIRLGSHQRQRPAPAGDLDWMMPGLDRIALCDRIRATPFSRRRFMWILLTARNSRQDLVAGLEASRDDFLTKPFRSGRAARSHPRGAADPRSLSPTSSGSPVCCRSAAIASASAPITTTGNRSKATLPSIATHSLSHGICPTCLVKATEELPPEELPPEDRAPTMIKPF